jgi:hypothetical protein
MFPLESTARTVAFPVQLGFVTAASEQSAPTTNPPLLAWLMLSATE